MSGLRNAFPVVGMGFPRLTSVGANHWLPQLLRIGELRVVDGPRDNRAGLVGAHPRVAVDGHRDRREHANNRDDNQQFNEAREPAGAQWMAERSHVRKPIGGGAKRKVPAMRRAPCRTAAKPGYWMVATCRPPSAGFGRGLYRPLKKIVPPASVANPRLPVVPPVRAGRHVISSGAPAVAVKRAAAATADAASDREARS